MGINYIIAIGIDKYKRTELNLSTCVKDCEAVITILTSDYENFEVYQTLYNASATKEAILGAIDSFYKDDSKNKPFNNLLVYFAGRGAIGDTSSRRLNRWVPQDYNGQTSTMLELDALLQGMRSLEVLHLLVISDAELSDRSLTPTRLFAQPDDYPIAPAGLGFEPSRKYLAGYRSLAPALIQRLRDNSPDFNVKELLSQPMLEYGTLNLSLDNIGEYIFNRKAQSKSIGLRQQTAQIEKTKTGTHYILAIGIDNYITPRYRLDNCVKDCNDLIEALSTKYRNVEVFRTLYDEQANNTAILKAIREFRESPLNEEPNSLIIYYSGHGDRIPANGHGCWIPVDFSTDLEDEALDIEQVVGKSSGIKTRNFLIIADCCYAGTLVQSPTIVFPANNQPGTPIYDFFRWGLASSRRTQLSAAGLPGSNSAFTRELIDRLNNNIQSQLSVRDLAGSLITKFNAAQPQSVLFDKLDNTTNNIGEFIIEAKEDRIKVKRRYQYLSTEFKSLNYKPQKSQFRNFEKCTQNVHFTFFSGSPSCGLSFLANLALQSQYLPDHPTRIPVDAQYIGTSGNSTADLLSLITKSSRAAVDAKQYLFSQLNNTDIVIDIRFYQSLSAPLDVTPQRKQLLDDLSEVAVFINQQPRTPHRLFIFIVDEENADYESLVPANKIAAMDTIIIKKVNPLTQDEFLDWYEDAQQRSPRTPEGSSEFRLLFDELIKKKVPDIFMGKEDQPPVHVIKEVCIRSECSNLVQTLLNQ